MEGRELRRSLGISMFSGFESGVTEDAYSGLETRISRRKIIEEDAHRYCIERKETRKLEVCSTLDRKDLGNR